MNIDNQTGETLAPCVVCTRRVWLLPDDHGVCPACVNRCECGERIGFGESQCQLCIEEENTQYEREQWGDDDLAARAHELKKRREEGADPYRKKA